MQKPLRYSRQREKILELLKDTKEHPSADTIYHKMRETFPSISLGTVYRNLGVLHEQGLVNRIMHAEGPDRFDADVAMHSHFHCEICGAIFDLEGETAEQSSGVMVEGHRITRQTRSYYGTCRDCLTKSQ